MLNIYLNTKMLIRHYSVFFVGGKDVKRKFKKNP